MRTLNQAELGPTELAFRLETNHAVDVGRFIAFIDCLRWPSGGGSMPLYDLSIVEFSKGSIFGRLRVEWREPIDDERLGQMESELAAIRNQAADLARRGVEASERQAVAAEDQARSARTQVRQQWGNIAAGGVSAAAAVSMLILTLSSCVQSEKTNPCATAASDLMEFDGVTRLEFATSECRIEINKTSVPEMIRREQGLRAADGSASRIGFGRAVRESGWVEDATQAPEPHESNSTSLLFAAASDVPRRRSRGVDGARPASPSAPGVPLRDEHRAKAVSAPLRSFRGRVRSEGEVYRFYPEESGDDRKSMILVAPDPAEPLPEATYTIIGRLYRIPGEYPLLIAEMTNQITAE